MNRRWLVKYALNSSKNSSKLPLNSSKPIPDCVKVFVTDSVGVDADLLQAAIGAVAEITGKNDFPTLLYPAAFADENDMAYEKIYNLWVCSLQYSDEYFRYLKRLLRFV